mgnify:CR=1 FL=1
MIGLLMNKNNTSLRYMQVYLDLKSQITNGNYQTGTQIPIEKDLLSHYDISITTLRRAIDLLCREGMLIKKQGSGTFVNRKSQEVTAPAVETPVPPQARIAVLMPSVSRMTPEGDGRHWQINLRRVDGIYQEAARLRAGVSVFDLSEVFDLNEFDGAIIFRAFEIEMEDVFDKLIAPLKKAGKPFVVVSEYNLRFADKYWVVENLAVEFLRAYKYLSESGMKKLLVVGMNLSPENPRVNILPYVLDRKNYQFLENPGSDRESARKKMAAYLKDNRGLGDIDTIFCLTDLQALGVMAALLDYGIKIPDDVNLMGCDNISDGLTAPVPLTTFEFSDRSVGALALELLVRAIRGDFPDGLMITKRSRIVERDSVRPKR